MTDPGARVLLVLRPAPGCRAPWPALRRLLKILLRSFAWRCERAELLPPPTGIPPSQAEGGGGPA